MSESSDNPIVLQGPTPPRLRRRDAASTIESGKRDKGAKKPPAKVLKVPKPKPEPKPSKKRKAVEEKAIEGEFAFLTVAQLPLIHKSLRCHLEYS